MKTIVFFDLETGGLRPELDPIIQIAAIAVDASTAAEGGDFSELEVFERKLQFDPAKANPVALEMNTFSKNGPEVWKREAVPEREALNDFKDFLSRHATVQLVSKKPPHRPYHVAQLAGHNCANFDIPFLKAAFERHKLFCPIRLNVVLDTIHGAAWHFARQAEPESFKLSDLAKHFRVEATGQLHDALTDVRLTIGLARNLLR